MKKEKQENLFKRWYKLCNPNNTIWFFQILSYMIYAGFYASMTIFAAKTINCLYNGDWNGAFIWLAVELLDIILRKIVMHIEYILYCKLNSIIRKNVTSKIYDKILNCDEKNLKKMSPEKIINIAQNNLSHASEFPDYIANILQYLVQIVIAFVAIFTSNVYAGLVVVGVGIINFFAYNAFNKKLGRIMDKRFEKKDDSFKEYSRIISGKPVIEELGANDVYKEKLMKHMDDYTKEFSRYYLVTSWQGDIYSILWHVILYAVTAFLIYLVSANSFDLALYLVVVPYLTSCTEKLNTLYSKFGSFENVRVDVDRLNMILSLNDKQMIQYGNVNKMSDGYNLGLIDVSYKNENIELKNIDISFRMNGLNIIKGERNCGKRCIFDMLRRNIKPDSGRVLLDNLDLYDYNQKTFKNHIDYCASHPIFIKGNVKENLLVAKNDFEFIKAQVEELGLTEVIESLPQGYETQIEDIKSGEIRFWIGLIRASLSTCKVLMIYEYPEDVSENFHTILKNIILTSESDKRTLIFFTHKNDYDETADLLYEIKNGKIKSINAHNKKSKI